MAKSKRFSDQLRAVVLNADVTRYQISKATDIPESNLSRFVHGEAGLSLESIDRLAEFLNLRVVGPNDTPKAKGK
jgi:hypothetical protein